MHAMTVIDSCCSRHVPSLYLQLSQIGRCEYERTCTLLVQSFDEAAQKYEELLSTGNTGNPLVIQEGE